MPTYDKYKAVAYLDKIAKAKSQQKCAYEMEMALADGGLKGVTGHAWTIGRQLTGFCIVDQTGYSPLLGDIVVFDKNQYHPYGHAQMYNGSYWESDFRQDWIGTYNALPTGGLGFGVYGNSVNTPPFTIYRFPTP